MDGKNAKEKVILKVTTIALFVALSIAAFGLLSSCKRLKEHSFSDWTAIVAQTCESEGVESRSCSKCGKKETRNVPPLGHDKTEHKEQAATCLSVGWKEYETCSRCDYTTYEEIEALGHDKTEHKEQASTCLSVGWKEYETCSRCDYTTYEEIEALGHDKTTHKAQAATCLNVGWKEYETCSRCDYTTYEEIEELGHDKTTHKAQAATCLSVGWKEYETCSRCDYTTYEEIDRLEHKLTTIKGSPNSCFESGTRDYDYCSLCEKSYIDGREASAEEIYLPPEHSLVFVAEEPKTCLKNGRAEHYRCEKCGQNYVDGREVSNSDLVIKKGCEYGELIVGDGFSVRSHYRCSLCGKCYDERKNEITELGVLLGHTLEWVDREDATCCVNGKEGYYKCSDNGCGLLFDVNYQEISEDEIAIIPKGHRPSEETREDENGRCRECLLCGDKIYEEAELEDEE